MPGSFFEMCGNGIRQDTFDPNKADEISPGSVCCQHCGCFCISWLSFPTDFCFHEFGSWTGLGSNAGTPIVVACNPVDYPCIAIPVKTFPATGGACEGPKTGCFYDNTAYHAACSVCDQFRFHTGGAPGDAGAIPLLATGGWTRFYSGPALAGEPIEVWIRVEFQPLQVAPHCTGIFNVAGGPNPIFADKPACCCDGTGYPCRTPTGAMIPAPAVCMGTEPPYEPDGYFTTPDSTVWCSGTSARPTC